MQNSIYPNRSVSSHGRGRRGSGGGSGDAIPSRGLQPMMFVQIHPTNRTNVISMKPVLQRIVFEDMAASADLHDRFAVSEIVERNGTSGLIHARIVLNLVGK